MRHRLVIGLAAALVLAVPALAQASTFYVDADTGTDGDNTSCLQATPCRTIPWAVSMAELELQPNSTILLDAGTYDESVTLSFGETLNHQNFVTGSSGPAIIDGGNASAVEVQTQNGATIKHLTLRGGEDVVKLSGPATVTANTFDDPDSSNSVGVDMLAGADGSAVSNNSFTDPNPGATRARVAVVANASGTVSGNTISNQMVGIAASPPSTGTLTVSDNTITGTHNAPYAGAGISTGPGTGQLVIEHNLVGSSAGTGVNGVAIDGPVALRRNTISGSTDGVFVGSDVTGVSLDSDLIYGNTQDGLLIFDTGSGGAQTSVAATNVTIDQPGANAAELYSSHLALDSSITTGYVGGSDGDCDITFSRGDSIGSAATGCDAFQTDAPPLFVDAAGGDYRLQASSQMIDAGNPADPAAGALDLEGDPRAVDATPHCSGDVARRDIGADEFVPQAPDCTAPNTKFTKKPARKVMTRKVRVAFAANEPATFRCSLDSAAFKRCSSPKTFRVGYGKHTIEVRATDTSGNVEGTPAKAAFKRVHRHHH